MSSDRYLYCVAFPSSKKPGYLCVNNVVEQRDQAEALAADFGRTGFVITYPAAGAPVVGQYLHFGLLEAAGLI